MLQIYRQPLLIIWTIAINALLFFTFFFIEQIFDTSTLISLITALGCMVLFNLTLWWVGIFNKNDSINQRLFKEFTENINEVFWQTTPDLSETIYVSAAYNEIWGRSRENLYKNPKEWFESIIPEDQEKVKNTLLNLTQEDIPNVTFEFKIKRPNGDIRQIYTRGFKFKNKNGKLINILGISTDITTYKEEEQVKTVLNDIKNILDRQSHLAIVAPKVLKIICMARNWDYGEMWLVDKEANVLRSISIWDNSEWDIASGFDAKSQDMTFIRGATLPGKIWQLGQLIWIDDLDNIKLRRMKEANQAGFHSAVGIPIFMNNQIIGVLDFFSQDIRKPDEIATKMLTTICEQIGQYIEKKHTEDQVIFTSRHDSQTFLLNQSWKK